jgi:hypothetical protein
MPGPATRNHSLLPERAVALHGNKRIKLPEAIIRATARISVRLLVIRNTRDFTADGPGMPVPY